MGSRLCLTEKGGRLAAGSVEISRQLEAIEKSIEQMKSDGAGALDERLGELLQRVREQRREAQDVVRDPYVLEFLELHDEGLARLCEVVASKEEGVTLAEVIEGLGKPDRMKARRL